jgi:hypothetical protein
MLPSSPFLVSLRGVEAMSGECKMRALMLTKDSDFVACVQLSSLLLLGNFGIVVEEHESKHFFYESND